MKASSIETTSEADDLPVPPEQETSAPFYFTPSKLASFFHCVAPNLTDVVYVQLIYRGIASAADYPLAIPYPGTRS